MEQDTKDTIRMAWDATKKTLKDAKDQAVAQHEDMLREEEREYMTQLAAAAMVDAKVPDTKIVELLRKYFCLEANQAATALGKGRLLAERKKGIAELAAKVQGKSKKK